MKMKLILLNTSFLMLNVNFANADEKDLYDFMWLDPDKKVYVLQNKVHKKENSIYANIGYGLGLSSNFQDSSALHFNLGYNLTEDWALELLYTKLSNKDNDDMKNLTRINGTVPFIRKIDSNYAIIAKWSPFYGKINTFNKIFYFDWHLGAGLGKIEAQSNAKTVSDPTSANQYNEESYTSLMLKTGLSFHASKNIHIGIDLLVNNYKAPGPVVNSIESKEKMRTNMDAVFTIGFSY